ncbi:MAG TPA: 50S ribosomal protein L5 [Candidatus Acidoferrum sp.]|nr:50S ribosomal protein L5 [Candidatus Acidoferrum sp.]
MDSNKMQDVMVSKLVINIGTGNEEKRAEPAKRLLELITGKKPAEEISKRRAPAFKITKGQIIGAYVTIRGPEKADLLKRLLDAADNKVKESGITPNSLSFGIKEYIDIRGIKYDPAIGMLGMNVNVAFRRKGARVMTRKRMASRIPKRHSMVSRELIKDYVKKEFGAEVV